MTEVQSSRGEAGDVGEGEGSAEEGSVKFHTMRARCKMPNHIHAPTTVQKTGHGLI